MTIPGFASAERNYENLADEDCDCEECEPPLVDLASAECIVKAAHRAVEVMAARIAADPDNPLVPDLQRIAEMAQHLINESRTK